MSRDKQIEEMAKIICGSHNNGACVFNHEPCDLECSANGEAKKLYDSGYRKASEVAREIFEEVERVVNFALCVDITEWSAFAELKKKYTEEK